jgi:hypothetical protein
MLVLFETERGYFLPICERTPLLIQDSRIGSSFCLKAVALVECFGGIVLRIHCKQYEWDRILRQSFCHSIRCFFLPASSSP